jgi:ketosteroid isomerase-like protein
MEQKKFDREQKAVMEAILGMTDSFHKKDIDGVMASYETDAVIAFEPGKPVSDSNTIREGFNGFFALNPKFTYSGHEVFVSGDLAIHFAPWSMVGKTPDGNEVQQKGLSVAVLRKQPNGKWLMVFDNPFGQHLLERQ